MSTFGRRQCLSPYLIKWLEAIICGLTFITELVMSKSTKTSKYYLTCFLCLLALISCHTIFQRVNSILAKRWISYEDPLYLLPGVMLLLITIMEYVENIVGYSVGKEQSEKSHTKKIGLILSLIMFVVSLIAPISCCDEKPLLSWEENAESVDLESQISNEIEYERESSPKSSSYETISRASNASMSGLIHELACLFQELAYKFCQGMQNEEDPVYKSGYISSKSQSQDDGQSQDDDEDEDVLRNHANVEDSLKNQDNHSFIGLKNDFENSCFLNATLQALWNTTFGWKLKNLGSHRHGGDPCIVCAVIFIFQSMSGALKMNLRDAIDTSRLRRALTAYDTQKFPMDQKCDAVDAMEAILQSIHASLFCGTDPSEFCIVHKDFVWHMSVTCLNCSGIAGLGSFFHDVNACKLREMKSKYPDLTFTELLNLVQNEQENCILCAKKADKQQYTVARAPDLFVAVIGWRSKESTADILADILGMLSAISLEVDMKTIYSDLKFSTQHRLVSMVCYSQEHIFCFVHDNSIWWKCDDGKIRGIGGWADVLSYLETGVIRPIILLFEDDTASVGCVNV